MFTDTQPNGELANACVTASCLAHGRKVWTGGDAHEWRHQDNQPCAGQRVEHSKTCTCWDCQGDPFAGISQPDEPFAGVVVLAPAELADFLAEVNRRELERRLFFREDGSRRPVTLRGVQADLFDVATTALVEPGMNGVLF